MQKVMFLAAAAGLLAASSLPADAMAFSPMSGADATSPAIVHVADRCGPGRFRGVGGYCEGRRPINVRKVCTVRGYPGALIRRCRLVPLR